MLKFQNVAALALLATVISYPAVAEDKPVAVVNGVAIPQARLDLRIKTATLQGQPDSPELRSDAREELISIELMAQEAEKLGMDKQDDVRTQLEFARQTILVGAYVQDYFSKNPVTDEAMKQEYESMKARTGTREYKARHILVKDESEARSVAAQLKKGTKFDKLAKKHSTDPGSKDKGGELDWSMPTVYVQPFADALVALKKGGTSEPVQSEFGWHIIRLDDVRDFNFPSFEEVKPGLMRRLQQMSGQKVVEDLRAKAKIE